MLQQLQPRWCQHHVLQGRPGRALSRLVRAVVAKRSCAALEERLGAAEGPLRWGGLRHLGARCLLGCQLRRSVLDHATVHAGEVRSSESSRGAAPGTLQLHVEAAGGQAPQSLPKRRDSAWEPLEGRAAAVDGCEGLVEWLCGAEVHQVGLQAEAGTGRCWAARVHQTRAATPWQVRRRGAGGRWRGC
jgi:hypothetical protein